MWRKGTLHAGVLDVQVGFFLLWGRYRGWHFKKRVCAQRVLFNLHRKMVHSWERLQFLGCVRTTPTVSYLRSTPQGHTGVSRVVPPQVPLAALKEKAKLYVDQGLIRQDMAERVIRVIESERGDSFYVNDVPADAQAAAGGGDSLSTRLSPEQMQALLERRVEMMKQGHVGNGAAVTDQYRVYSEIVARLEQGRPLRLMVQASAGTGTLALSMTAVGAIAIIIAIRQ